MSVSFLFVLLSACSDGPSLPTIDVPVRPVDATPDPEPPAPEPPAPEPPAPEPPVTPPPEPPAELHVADLAAVVLDGGPAFTRVRSFQPGDTVSAAWSGAACDAWVTPDRDWTLGDPLVDVRGAPTPLAVQPGRPVVPVASADDLPVQGAGSAFDLVLDCDHDGTLSAGDTVDGFAEPGFHVLPDLTAPGPHAVVQQGHGQGFTQQITYWPADIANLGQVPVVVVAHGYGHQLDYYAHLGEHLASWGYVVTSFRNDVGNGDGPGTRTASTTLLSNTEHLLANASTLVGGALDGHLDADRIVWIGHSTGGECVVRAYTRLHDGQYTSPWFDADSIALISSMAPVAWLPPSQSNPYDVPYHLITGGADRDTGNYPEPGYTRNMALFERASGDRHLTYIYGAGHGDLHAGPQNWLDQPDPGAPDLVGSAGAHPVVKAYTLALVEHYTRANPAMRDLFERNEFRPVGIPAWVTVATEYRPADDTTVLEDFQSGTGIAVTSSGGTLTGDVQHLQEILMDDQDGSFAWTGSQPSNGFTRHGGTGDDARAAVFDWSGPAHLELSVPSGLADASGQRALMLRVAQGTRHPQTVALNGPLAFTVTLRDTAGAESTLDTAPYGVVPSPYRRPGVGAGAGWANAFSTLTLPLADFGGVDLTSLAAVRFDFGGTGGPVGRVALDDVMFVR